LPKRALDWDAATTSPGHAYQAMFDRRIKRGQCFSIPALGWREFVPSYFGAFREETYVDEDMPTILIPSMLRQVFSGGYDSEVSFVYDTNVKIEKGVLEYDKGGETC
jgi:CRISPR-associated protein Cas5d